jgi:hypothetical protein
MSKLSSSPLPSVADSPASSGDSPLVPARRAIDRAALDRVLARAAAMQSGEGDEDDAISEARLIEIANEVGIDPAHIQLAAAEERARAPMPEERGLAVALAGPSWSAGRRTVRGTVPETLQAIERWMHKEERLSVQRRFPDRLTFERRESAAVALDRALNLTGRKFDLSRASYVAATVVAADPGRVVVRIDADQRQGRRSALIGALVAAMAAGAIALGWLLVMFMIIGVPGSFAALLVASAAVPLGLGALVGGLIVRGFRRSRERVQLGIEQLLDRLEHEGVPPAAPTLLERLDRAMR